MGSVNLGGISSSLNIAKGKDLIKYITLPHYIKGLLLTTIENTTPSKTEASRRRKSAAPNEASAQTAAPCSGYMIRAGRS